MEIKNIEGLSIDDINRELANGGKFVIYEYSISIIIMTFKQSSDIHFIKSNESGFSKGLGYTLLSLVAGWWGFPWGPIYTIGSVFTNLSGGKNVTNEVLATIGAQAY